MFMNQMHRFVQIVFKKTLKGEIRLDFSLSKEIRENKYKVSKVYTDKV